MNPCFILNCKLQKHFWNLNDRAPNSYLKLFSDEKLDQSDSKQSKSIGNFTRHPICTDHLKAQNS